jgi:ferric-dicitrate binding protein FerR (iron transport regulator)
MEELIVRYLQQDISEEEARTLEAWLQEMSDNKEMFFQLKGIFDSVKHRKCLSEAEVERSWQLMRSRLKLQSAVRPSLPAGRRRVGRALAYASVACALVLLGMLGLRYFGINPVMHGSYTEISVQKGGKPNMVTLADGTRVQLNAATTLRYPNNFSASAREVFVDGEAWFEVSEDDGTPFIVRLKQQTVTVHGTRFNIEAYAEEPCNIVTLMSGSVTLESQNQGGDRINSMRLQPGQRVCFDRLACTIKMEETDVVLAGTWTKGEYRFKDEPLLQIARRLENYYDVTIRFDDEALKEIKYTGTFSLNQSIREVLRIINHENRFLFIQSGNDFLIKSKKHVEP